MPGFWLFLSLAQAPRSMPARNPSKKAALGGEFVLFGDRPA
jgi:hypothetical protein